jgi:oligoribonuclease
MSTKPIIPLLWLDLETTGLIPEVHAPLEMAIVATDENLEIVDTFVGTYKWGETVTSLMWSDFARKMHEANGLIDHIKQLGYVADTTVQDAQRWIVGGGHKGKQMAGSSVQFDRTFGRHWFPELIDLFHYRNFDVRTLRTWYGLAKPEVNHRALDDLIVDIETVRSLRRQHEQRKSFSSS